jgi:hypothetical protein
MDGWDQNGSSGDWLGVLSGFSWLRIGGSCNYVDEPAGSGATELVCIIQRGKVNNAHKIFALQLFPIILAEIKMWGQTL